MNDCFYECVQNTRSENRRNVTAVGLAGMSLLEFHNMDGTGSHTFSTFDAIGMEITVGLPATVVRSELHRAYTGTTLTFHLAAVAYLDGFVAFGECGLLRRNECRKAAHRTKRTPSARGVNEGQRNAYEGRDEDNVPKYLAHCGPIAPSEVHLHAKHRENKEHHEGTEAFRPNKTRNGTVRGVLGEQAIVKIATRTSIATPPTSPTDCKGYWSNHTDDG